MICILTTESEITYATLLVVVCDWWVMLLRKLSKKKTVAFGLACILILWYNLYFPLQNKWQIPVLKKSFINKGAHVLYGPFRSDTYDSAHSNHSITFATHTTLKNFYYLQIISLVWKSPISVTVWAQGDITELVELVYLLVQSCAARRSLSVCILVPADRAHSVEVSRVDWQQINSPSSFTCSQRNLHNKFYSLRAQDPYQNYNSKNLPYPNNYLRNLALHQVKTSHVLVSDIDLMPSVNFDQQFMKYLHGLEDQRVHGSVLVVPVFESSVSQSNQWTIPRLLSEWRSSKVRPFYTETCPQCQGPTQYSKWLDRQSRDGAVMSATYVPYVPGWEPFVILKTSLHPRYDERFQQFGYNRMSLICELHVSGKEFLVLDSIFLVHDGFKTEDGFHEDKDFELRDNEKLYSQFRSELATKYNTKRHC